MSFMIRCPRQLRLKAGVDDMANTSILEDIFKIDHMKLWCEISTTVVNKTKSEATLFKKKSRDIFFYYLTEKKKQEVVGEKISNQSN